MSGPRVAAAAATTVGYFTNWWIVAGRNAGPLGHTWSLSVEEQFYLVWPLLLIATWRHRQRLTVLVAGAGVLIAVYVRTSACASGGCVFRIYHSTDTRMDQLLLGVLLALAFRAGLIARLPRRLAHLLGWIALGALTVIALSTTSWDARWYDTYGISATAALAVAVIAAILNNPDGKLARVLGSRPLTTVGLVSYGLYLWDGAAVVFLRDGTSLSAAPRAALTVAIIAMAAAASWRYVERPALRRARAAIGLRAAAHGTSPRVAYTDQ
jgi:peptidoglycan/LPS O-acetylase OafA/YrhL